MDSSVRTRLARTAKQATPRVADAAGRPQPTPQPEDMRQITRELLQRRARRVVGSFGIMCSFDHFSSPGSGSLAG